VDEAAQSAWVSVLYAWVASKNGAYSLEKPWFKFYPKDVPRSIDYPNITLSEALKQSAQKFPDNSAIIYFGKRITYRELDDLVDRFATALQDLGAKKGDRVGVQLPNIPQFVIAFYGALRAGAICVACSPLYKARELEHQLKDSGTEILVCMDKLYPIVQEIRHSTALRNVIATSPRDYLPPLLRLLSPLKGVKSYACPGALDFMSTIQRYDPSPKPVAVNPDDLALLQYTGGTTGIPKGAMITHRNLIANAAQCEVVLPIRRGIDINVAALPLFHIFGMTCAMNAPILTGTTMLMIPDPRDPKAILSAINKHNATIFCSVPTMYVALINRPDIKKYDISTVRACLSGAAPLPVEVQKKFEQITGGRLVEGYGLTESSPVTHVNPLDDPKKNRPGSIGIPVPDTDAKIVDIETGSKDLKPNEVGELVIKGPQVMRGYWNKPDETKMTLKAGWLYTGDIAKIDDDGYFYIVDRKKDMIDVSGLKVWPREVEEVLYEHPAVNEAAVVGVSDAYRGETVKAYVSLKPEYQGKVTEEAIIKFCKERIANYKAPRIVEFRESLPKTLVGKVLRRTLREEAKTKK
jgi:long-chain acyl-CoA synthetase